MPTMAAIVDMDSASEATAMAVLATAMARGLLTPRLMPTMATEAMEDMVLATPLATVLATAMVVMARGQLTLRPMLLWLWWIRTRLWRIRLWWSWLRLWQEVCWCQALLWIRWSLHRLRIWWIRTWSWLWLRQVNNEAMVVTQKCQG